MSVIYTKKVIGSPDGKYGMQEVKEFVITNMADEEANLVPENIKKDVTIFGVTGTYEPEPAE